MLKDQRKRNKIEKKQKKLLEMVMKLKIVIIVQWEKRNIKNYVDKYLIANEDYEMHLKKVSKLALNSFDDKKIQNH